MPVLPWKLAGTAKRSRQEEEVAELAFAAA
jgi:hypothetical protein